MEFTSLIPQYFHFFRWSLEQLPARVRPFVNFPEHNDLVLEYARNRLQLFWHPGGAGYGLSSDGELRYVHNSGYLNGLGVAAVEDALTRTRKTVWLTAFDVPTLEGGQSSLVKFYKRRGFVEVGRERWDEDEAPEGWFYPWYGTPDVVRMEYGRG